jgi:hypothetical protein
MSFSLRAGLFLRSLFKKDTSAALAEVEAAGASEALAERLLRDAPAREMAAIETSRAPAIGLGSSLTSGGETFRVELREEELRRGGHWLFTGATGAGKSYLALSLVEQLLARRPSGIVVVDMKGELADLLREKSIPALVGSLPEDRGREILERIAVIAPFDEAATPPLQVLARDRSIPIEVQAHEVASSFGRTIGRDLGVLQSTLLKFALILAIDVGLTLPEVPQLLQDPALLRGAVARCTLADVRHYFAERFPRERGASVASLLSRLDSLLMHPTLRRMLGARGMTRFDRLLEHAVTIVNLGGAPAGMSEIGRFFGQLVFGKIVRAVFSRRVTPTTPHVTVVADEFQELLSPEIAHDFERFLTLARSQRVFLWAMFQQAAQVEAVSPTLLRILKTNTNYQCVFRSNIEDARAMAHVLPATGRRVRESPGFPDPRTPRTFIPIEEERRALVEQVPSMPDRVFFFLNKRRPYGAILTKSATLSIDKRAAFADELDAEVRAALHRGVLAVSPEDIERAREERAAFLASLAGRAPTTGDEGPRDAGAAAPEETHREPAARNEAPPSPSAEGEAERPRRRRGTNLG